MGGKAKSGGDPFWSSHAGGSRRGGGRCHDTHPELKLGNGVFVGGSGYDTREGFDVYVDVASTRVGMDSLPWETPVEISFGITDQSVPRAVSRFKAMVTYLCTQLQAGKRVHVGCFGGHGRTGLVLAAVYKELTGEKDAIQWVRKNHCKKAVESTTQIHFLMEHYGVSTAAPTKGYGPLSFTGPDPFKEQFKEPPTPPERAPASMSLGDYMKLQSPKAAPKAKDGAHVPDPLSNKCVWR